MSIRVGVGELQAAGFPMGGEPLVALDLVDTLMTVTEPATDLIGAPEASAAWWALQSGSLPPGPVPGAAAVRRLRAAVRDVLDSHLEGRPARSTSVDDINAAAAAAPVSPRLVVTPDGIRGEERWHTEHGGNAALAAIAAETIGLLADNERLGLLRRCANPACSMLFLAENKRRKWCTSNICGNRARVARHYERTHTDGAGGI
ncbi:CGNR zinc finger domain-containing protein [Streptomyces mirabilis]|uniref:CGNR zinc finger domain-containing protein n=1 Tax=Streptomyces mirabilis TaxID=68239 RepID=UPI00167C7458|nr:CGNR zinc finger domain-containing protein [Streptomyces mirabilis]